MMIRRRNYNKLLTTAQLLTLVGPALAIGWNVLAWQASLPAPGLWSGLLPLPGLILWGGLLCLPWLAGTRPEARETFRLVYDAADNWQDEPARQALIGLVEIGAGPAIIWAGEDEGVGCWLSVTAGYRQVLQRVVEELFPSGQLEPAALPEMGPGVILLNLRQPLPAPLELLAEPGLAGLYYCYLSHDSATLALWGRQATAIAADYADLLPGEGLTLQQPFFTGDNPWPTMPPFPVSPNNPALAATSSLERVAPALRLTRPGLVLGPDPAGQPGGLAWSDLAELGHIQIFGHAANRVVTSLARQVIQTGLPVVFLDGQGGVTARLSRLLSREVALGQVLVCDTDQPAQAHFRLNPLWLPEQSELWPEMFNCTWPVWLRDCGVTAAGLGQLSYRYTLISVILTVLAAAGQGLVVDVPTLRHSLETPDFLTLLEADSVPNGQGMLGQDWWQWWLAEGRTVPNFDRQLRLSHLRNRLETLLSLPEYEVLWRPPYLDLRQALAPGNQSLLWRLPDPRRRLRVYIGSQLLALTTLARTWPGHRPLIIITHELALGAWRKFFGLKGTVLIEAGRSVSELAQAATLIISRLDQADTPVLQDLFEDIRVADLGRLPDNRLLLRQGQVSGTLTLSED